jgi:hypothetical protein
MMLFIFESQKAPTCLPDSCVNLEGTIASHAVNGRKRKGRKRGLLLKEGGKWNGIYEKNEKGKRRNYRSTSIYSSLFSPNSSLILSPNVYCMLSPHYCLLFAVRCLLFDVSFFSYVCSLDIFKAITNLGHWRGPPWAGYLLVCGPENLTERDQTIVTISVAHFLHL